MPTSAFNAAAPLAALKTLLEGVSGIGRVYIGTPESSARQVIAYIAFLGLTPTGAQSSGLVKATLRYFVGIGYRVEGAEQTAEETMAAASVEFAQDFYTNRNAEAPAGRLSGTVDSMGITFPELTEPVYTTLANQVFRVTPSLITATQQQTFPL